MATKKKVTRKKKAVRASPKGPLQLMLNMVGLGSTGNALRRPPHERKRKPDVKKKKKR